MIISVDSQGRPELQDVSNFRAFKLIAASRPALALLKGGSGGVQVADEAVAWVRQDWIVSQSGLAASAEWRSGFDKMVAFAASKGWIRDSDKAVRAHIEYAE